MKVRSEAICLAASLLLAGLCVVPSAAHAELIQFTIDQTQSALAISGTFAGFTIEPQGPGSLMARYTGTIVAEVAGSDIQFVGGSMIVALTNGNWEPAAGGAPGAAPADYGGEVVNFLVNGKAAMRNVLLDVTSDVLPVGNGAFPAQGLQFSFIPAAASVIDYNYSLLIGGSGNGSQVLSGSSTNAISTNATVIAQGEGTVLTIPLDISGSVTVLNPNDVQYRFRGQLVARATASVPSQINSFQFSAGQLNFTIATTPGQAYTILGSTNLADWPEIIDQFTATNSLAERTVALPASLPRQYFRVRQD
jgi:hypothetical protein